MARGGKRKGAGRKEGSKDKMKLRMEEAMASGEMPHEFLLRVSRGEYIKHGDEKILPDFKFRMRAAEMSGSYFAPKLAQIEQKIESEVNYLISADVLTDEQFEQKHKDSLGSTTSAETTD